MEIHPWTMHEIARARNEERLLRGLAAYQALRIREEKSAESAATTGSGGRIRILDRLLRRETRAPARPAI